MTARRDIPFFPYRTMFAQHQDAYAKAMRQVLERGAFIMQQEMFDFEKNLAEYIGVKHAVSVANCTDGLIMAVRAAGIAPGDEVIFPSHTFVASAAGIHYAGATPVPVECGADHLIDPAAVEVAITSKTKAIMPVHINGRSCQMDAIIALAQKHNLLIIEDAAQALGATFQGRCTGTFGVAAAYSFYPAKTLGAFGDAGAVVTNDDAIAHALRLMRDHGRDPHTGEVVMWGLNSRLDTMQAAVLNVNLQHYPTYVARRREVAARYHAGLHDVQQVVLPPAPDSDARYFDIFQNFEIEADQRDQLRAHVKELGIGTLVQWGGTPVHAFRKLGFTQHLPKTEALFTRCCMLPMNTALSNDDVDYICDAVRGFYATAR